MRVVGPRRHHHTACCCKNAVTVCDDLTIVFDRLRYELFTELRGPTELPDERGRLPDKPAVCEMLKKHITKLGKDAVTVLQGKEEAGEEVRGVNVHTRSRTSSQMALERSRPPVRRLRHANLDDRTVSAWSRRGSPPRGDEG